MGKGDGMGKYFSVAHPKGNNNSSGFSLVELLIVVAILAILAAIAIPLFLNQRVRAAQATVQSDARNIVTDLTAIFANLPLTADATVLLNGEPEVGAVLTGSGTISVAGETANVNLSPGVTITKTGATSPTSGSGLKATYAEVPNWACAVSLPFTVQYSQVFGLPYECGTIVSETGNLLPVNQATFTPTNPASVSTMGWSAAFNTITLYGEGYTQYGETALTDPALAGGYPSGSYINQNVLVFTPETDIDGYLTGTVSFKKTGVQPQETVGLCLRIYDNVNSGWGAMMVNKCQTITLTEEWQTVTISSDMSVLPHPAHRANLIFGQGTDRPAVTTFAFRNAGMWTGEGGNWVKPGVPVLKN